MQQQVLEGKHINGVCNIRKQYYSQQRDNKLSCHIVVKAGSAVPVLHCAQVGKYGCLRMKY